MINLVLLFLFACSPNYIETAIYGRKWMNKLILQLLEISPSHKSFSSSQKLVKEQTQSLITLFLTKEESLAPNGSGATKAPSWEATQLTRVTKLLYEYIGSIENLDNTQMANLSWLTPMLEKCLESRNETLRRNVQRLHQKISKASSLQTNTED